MFSKAISGILAGAMLAMGTVSAIAEDYKARFAVDGFVLGTLVRVADAKGYFAEENVQASLLTFSFGTDTVDAVLAGQADFGVIIDIPILTRFPLGKLVSPAFLGAPKPGWHKLYVPAGYKTPEDLRGKKIAIATGTAQDFVTRTHLEDNGLDPDKDVELVGLPSLFEIIGAMKAGKVDAAWIWGQGPEQLGDDAKFKFEADDSVVNQKTTSLLVVSKEYIDANREGTIAILKALAKAGNFVQGNPAEAAQLVAKGIAGDAEKVQPVMQGQNFGLSFNADNMAAMVAKHGFLESAGKLDPKYGLATYIDLEVLRAAMPDGDIVEKVE